MNGLQQLINQLCPNGVEWKTLGEVCEILDSKRKPVSKSKRVSGQYPYYGANGVQDYVDNYLFDGTYLLVGEDGSVINPDKSPVVNWASGKIWVNNHAHILAEKSDVALLRFIFYSLQCVDVSDIVRGVPPKINQENLKGIQIPLPPLAIQSRIVEILDHFTNLTANLTAELALRRKQFEHFREKLLSLDGVEGVEMKKLFDVAKNSTGLTYKPSDVSDSGTLVLRSSNIQNSMLCFDDNVFVQMASIPARALVKENDILVCVRNGSSALIGKAAIIDKSCDGMAFGAFMTILRAFNINYKYLYYVWQSDRVQKMVHGDSGAPINQITNAVLDKIMIPCPSDTVQQSIVAKLDKFTALIQNIENELALRQKQYEYYREKLLSFPSPSL